MTNYKIERPEWYTRAREIASRVTAPVDKSSPARGEIYIYDDIGASPFSDGITAKDVAASLDKMKGVKQVDVFISSAGGSVFEGVAILALLDRFSARKIVHVDAVAASIASVIAMAGDEIVMAPSATMMIHDPYAPFMGNAAEMRGMADLLDKLAGTLVSAYARRPAINADGIRKLMLDETWMSAEEAVELGFADSISHTEKAAPRAAMVAPVASAPVSACNATDIAEAARIRRRALAAKFPGPAPESVPGQPGKRKP